MRACSSVVVAVLLLAGAARAADAAGPAAAAIVLDDDDDEGVLAPGPLGAPVPRFSNRFSVGVRTILPFDAVRPFLWTAFHHGHVVDVKDAVRDPAAVLAASDAAGVRHASGAEGGLGVVVPFQLDVGGGKKVALEGVARASLLWMPSLLGAHDEVTSLFDVALAFPLELPLPS